VLAVTEFRPSYERAAVMQATLALLGALAATVRWGLGGQIGWLIGGLLLGAVVPFTLIVILPTTELLLDVSLDLNSPESAALRRRKLELSVNLKAAKALGLMISQSLLLRADEIIHP
jgi:hypothetical protein